MGSIAVEEQVPAVSSGMVNCDPAPRVDSFEAATATLDELLPSLKKNGACYLRNLVSKTDMATIVADVRPHLDDDTPWQGACFPRQTRRLCGIISKSDTFRAKMVMDPLWLSLAKATSAPRRRPGSATSRARARPSPCSAARCASASARGPPRRACTATA